MARYLHWYNDKEDFEENYWGGNYVEPWVSITVDGEKRQTDFDRKDYKELFKTPLTFEFSEGGEFYFYYDAITDEYKKTVTYSLNGGPKVQVTPTSENTITVAVEQGDVIQVWGDNETYSHRINSSENAYFFFGSDCEFDVSGNIMSLIRSNGFEKLFSFSRERTFSHLFFGCENLSRADILILPAIELTDRCYAAMFAGCTSLITAPELPATTLADYCYNDMFNGCINLASAPSLPATTLANYCYNDMFLGCTRLASAPSLPATTLADYCYREMFWGCTNLTTAPELPATTLANNCYQNMFQDCRSLTSAPALPATTLAKACYYRMFGNCRSLTSAPELPATTLANNCYNRMFNSCMSLTSAPELPATTLAVGCYDSMFSGCINLNYIKCLATNISASDCTYNWVSGVQTSSGTFVKSASTDWSSKTGNDGIPAGWTVESDTLS